MILYAVFNTTRVKDLALLSDANIAVEICVDKSIGTASTQVGRPLKFTYLGSNSLTLACQKALKQPNVPNQAQSDDDGAMRCGHPPVSHPGSSYQRKACAMLWQIERRSRLEFGRFLRSSGSSEMWSRNKLHMSKPIHFLLFNIPIIY